MKAANCQSLVDIIYSSSCTIPNLLFGNKDLVRQIDCGDVIITTAEKLYIANPAPYFGEQKISSAINYIRHAFLLQWVGIGRRNEPVADWLHNRS